MKNEIMMINEWMGRKAHGYVFARSYTQRKFTTTELIPQATAVKGSFDNMGKETTIDLLRNNEHLFGLQNNEG